MAMEMGMETAGTAAAEEEESKLRAEALNVLAYAVEEIIGLSDIFRLFIQMI